MAAAAAVTWAVGAGRASSAPAPPTAPATRSDATAHLLFVGDVMVGRYVGAGMAAHGFDAPFAAVRSFLQLPDLTIGNLEGPLVPAGAGAIPPPSPGLLDLTGSDRAAPALARAGFDVLALANNHSLDAGESGLAATRRALSSAGITPIGVLGDADRVGGGPAGQTPVIRAVRGIRVAFLAYTLVLNPATTSTSAVPPERAAAAIAYLDPGVDADLVRAAGEVAAARRSADVVAVVMHWGVEYAARPNGAQQRVARALAAAGADVVVGAHPHVVQGVEALGRAAPASASTRPATPTATAGGRTTLVAYSLGNALFDQGGDAATREGAALAVDVDRGGVASARLIPLAIRGGPTGFATRRLDEARGGGVIARASASTPAELRWRTLSRVGQPAAGSAVAYRRTDGETAGGRAAGGDAGDAMASADDAAASSGDAADLGLGRPTRVALAAGRLTVLARAPDGDWTVVWRSEPGWRVDGYTVGDVGARAGGERGDDLIYWLRKPQLTWSRPPGGGLRVLPDGGPLRPHLFVDGWRRGAMRPVWHGSARPGPVLAAAAAPIGPGGRPLLATVEGDGHGDAAGGAPATGALRLWAWTGGFGFQMARAVAGRYADVWERGGELLFR